MWTKKRDYKSKVIVGVFLIQGIVGFIIAAQTIRSRLFYWEISNTLILTYAIINILGIAGIKYLVELLKKDIEHQKALVELQKSGEVIMALRAHKHDFFNHLQVISGLAQLEKTERIVEYIQSISKDVSQSYEIANIDIPEIAIVLMQKLGGAAHKGIKVETHINTTCEHLRGEGIVYAQILFNLLDNAICELEQIEEENRLLRVKICEQANEYQFVIYNNLPIIPKVNIEHLFKRGFSTKKGEHCGLGLWNVQKLVKINGGRIKVKSVSAYGTEFTVIFPKK